MIGTAEIEPISLGIYLLIFTIPMLIFRHLKLNISKDLFISVIRMTVQLLLVGIYLKYIFELDSLAVNILWILTMLFIANMSVLKQSGLSLRKLGSATFAGMLFTAILTALSFLIVMDSSELMEARYLIPLMGMLLGNLLRYNIVSLSRFYSELKNRENEYIQLVSLGATPSEATLPYLREALKAGVAPQIGGLATMGLVSLPGMMTGQILGGSLPLTAIKYQLLILAAIFVAGTCSALLIILLSRRVAFDQYNRLDHSIYRK